ncbi:MAG: DUF4974 domain-containing protein [Chitinophagaceae bacterium]|nr:DUF4974 domain-containing protein [Chitinophagaceae bacterium]
MPNNKIWQLVARKLSDEASPEERKELESLLQKDPELAYQVDIYCHYFDHPSRETDRTAAAKEKSLDFFRRQFEAGFASPPEIYPAAFPEPKPGARPLKRWVAVAAGLITIAVTFFFLTENKNKHHQLSQHTQNEVNTLPGIRSRTILPDGSVVWLNADSKVIYDENFRGNLREVHLEGEAFFDVVKDDARPFIIHTKTIDVRVLGTAFNVRSYGNENSTETALFRGSVEITLRNKPDKKIVLKPNEKIKISNKSADGIESRNLASASGKNNTNALSMQVSKVHFREKDSSALDVLWVKNKLAFDAETLELVAKKIERWYDVKVKIENDDLRNVAYSAIFDNENIEEVMEALKISGNFKYTIDKDVITIR